MRMLKLFIAFFAIGALVLSSPMVGFAENGDTGSSGITQEARDNRVPQLHSGSSGIGNSTSLPRGARGGAIAQGTQIQDPHLRRLAENARKLWLFADGELGSADLGLGQDQIDVSGNSIGEPNPKAE